MPTVTVRQKQKHSHFVQKKNRWDLTRMAVGAASPTAQGQAITMTARANMKENRAGPARIVQFRSGQPSPAQPGSRVREKAQRVVCSRLLLQMNVNVSSINQSEIPREGTSKHTYNHETTFGDTKAVWVVPTLFARRANKQKNVNLLGYASTLPSLKLEGGGEKLTFAWGTFCSVEGASCVFP